MPPYPFLRRCMLLLLVLLPAGAAAQNFSGVSSPTVRPGERGFQLRSSFLPADDGADARYGFRVHYQEALTDTLRARGSVAVADRGAGSLDVDAVKLELQKQLSANFGMRLDGSLGGSGRNDAAALNFYAQLPATDALTLRGVVQVAREFGDTRRDGLQFQTRGAAVYRLSDSLTLSGEAFARHGKLGSGGADDSIQAGPRLAAVLGDGWTVEPQWLWGATGPVPDNELRLWIGRRF
ncbi:MULTISPECIES: hypothetical protein [Pacificimonas]|nr:MULTISPECIES: hypothetical protein [Pacificimonas]MBZ6378203.1 hypothetical protein [Pacificimonas aurantium]